MEISYIFSTLQGDLSNNIFLTNCLLNPKCCIFVSNWIKDNHFPPVIGCLLLAAQFTTSLIMWLEVWSVFTQYNPKKANDWAMF